MPRDLPSPMITEITSNQATLCWLCDLALVSGVEHVWTGYGNVTWNGNTYRGIGDLGSVGDITESSETRADGTSIGLSGINPTLLAETLADIQQTAPVTLWLATFDAGAIAAAYPAFVGGVDRPGISAGPDALSIVLALENKMADHQRATNRRYTMADQRIYYPDDIGFFGVEILNDQSLLWG